MTAMSALCQIATWQLDRDRSSYRPRSDIHRRTYQTSCAPGDDLVSRLRRRGTERKFFNDFSRAPALARTHGSAYLDQRIGSK